MLIPEDLCNRSPSFSALMIREETLSPLPVGFPTVDLAELTQQQWPVIAPCYGVVLLLLARGGAALLRSPFRLGVPDQASMLSPLPEVHAPGDTGPDITGPADAQHLRENDLGKDKGSLGVPVL